MSALSPGDKQVGWITRHNICLQECFSFEEESRKKERKKEKPYNSPGLLPKPRLWPGSANVQFPKSSRTVYQHVLWGKQPNSTPPLFGPKRQSLRCLWKAQEGVEIRKHHIFFSDNCEFPLLHLAFNFHQNKLFTKINVRYNQGPSSFYLGYRGSGTLGSDYTLCFSGALPHVIVGWFLLI